MKLYMLFVTITLLVTLSCGTSDSENASGESAPVSTEGVTNLTLPKGFVSEVIHNGIGKRARHMAMNDNGDIYLKMETLEEHHGIVALRDTDRDGNYEVQGSFGDFTGTEVRIYKGYLYASSDSAIFRYKLQEGSIWPDTLNREAVITGFPKQGSHASKTFTFDTEGNMYVNVGAPSNACQDPDRVAGAMGEDPCPQLEWQAAIWKYDASKLNQTQSDGKRYVTGIRNCVALDWNESTHSLFAMQHGRDQLWQFWPHLYDSAQSAELPSEEFLQMNEGDDFGWPYCYYDHIKGEKLLSPEYGGNAKDKGRCTDKKYPIMGFPGHMAPNSLLFYTGDQFPSRYKNGAFIAFHGSWNRGPLPQKGYFVVFVPFKDGEISGEWEVFADGFSGLDVVEGPGQALHRPVGLVQSTDGSLFVSDSQRGRIWKISYVSE